MDTPSTLLMIGARLVFALLLLAVQAYVLRALTRIIHLHGLTPRRERQLTVLARVFIVLVNLPTFFFVLESIFSPRTVLLYNPAAEYEGLARPIAYLFFVWNLGSIFFALLAPVSMAIFALVQFVRRRKAASDERTVEVFDLSRRSFLRLALMAAAAMPFAVSAYGAVAARRRQVVERVTVPVTGLPAQLDGLTIVQMSDIHSGVFMTESQMREYVEMVNELKPDLVALTGDFVSNSRDQVEPFLRAISHLKPRLGVFGCLGNHDMYTRAEQQLTSGFNALGFKLLRNQNVLIEEAGATLNVIGLDFFPDGVGRGRAARALSKLSLEGTTILLLHAPYDFEQAAALGIDLMLSGHTHGGQIALTFGDFVFTPARLTTMFIAGLFRIGDSHLYVNRGLGTTGPPIRINAPPEITHLTLKRA
jgi:predicted MPP superfamily phosphohydrolase